MEYYKSEKSKDNLKKPIDLRDCKSIDGYLHNKKWQHIFCLNTERRRYFLVADDEESMKTWLSNLCDVCGFNKQHSVDPERGIVLPFIFFGRTVMYTFSPTHFVGGAVSFIETLMMNCLMCVYSLSLQVTCL